MRLSESVQCAHFLAGAPLAVMLADAGAPAVLADAPLAVMLADAGAPAVLALALPPFVLALLLHPPRVPTLRPVSCACRRSARLPSTLLQMRCRWN